MTAAPQKPEYKLKSLSNGKTVLFLMATAAEYLSDLKQLIDPVIIGVGPVEAAVNTGRILANVDRLPDYVILLGSAGSATLGQGE
ncbi:MAG: adenosylhomocysteine nucleosidase, partial [Maritalea sp.]